MHIKSLNVVLGWHFEDDQGLRLNPHLVSLLGTLNQHGKLTQAAKASGLSYRHAWNILNESAKFFGQPLATLEKGRGAKLTELGRKLLLGNQRVEARLHPQLESLATEINVELNRAMADLTPVIRIFASHGYAVGLVPQHTSGYQVEMHYSSPSEALAALREGRCRIAGFHQSIGVDVPRQRQRRNTLIDSGRFGIIRFIRRQQGLMYQPDNPKSIVDLHDLSRPDIRFINRQPDSGTRDLFDALLAQRAIDAAQIQGYNVLEYTHSAVAAHIASDMADVGFGVQTAAHRFGLAFTPMVQEYYLWLYPLTAEHDEDINAFLGTLRDTSFQQAIAQLPGYTCDHCGETTTAQWLREA